MVDQKKAEIEKVVKNGVVSFVEVQKVFDASFPEIARVVERLENNGLVYRVKSGDFRKRFKLHFLKMIVNEFLRAFNHVECVA